ncbi:MAG: membrane protein of unknown function [Candidatus Thorarchaeota archaeon]|nr:MAG: membrane protein of unknown function [Candidatus Thorarchaeota archaeon]
MSGEQIAKSEKPTKKSYVRSGLIFMTLSLAAHKGLLFILRILLARYLSVGEYGLVTYCWGTGTTIGFLLMFGREHDAVVDIPRMSPNELSKETKYLLKIAIGIGVVFLWGTLSILITTNVELRIWALVGYALSNLIFQMEYYTLISTKSFKSHLVLTSIFNGGSVLAVIILGQMSIITPQNAILSILVLSTVASVFGAILIRIIGTVDEKQHEIKIESKRVWSFSRFESSNLHYFTADICTTLIPLLPVLLLDFFAGYEEVGFFGLSLSLYRASVIIAVIINITYGPGLSKTYIQNKSEYSRLFRESFQLTVFLQGAGAIGLGMLAGPVISVLADVRYLDSINVLQILLFGACFEALYFVSSSVLRTAGHSSTLSRINIVALGVFVIIGPISVALIGLQGAALSYAIVVGVQASCSFTAVWLNKNTYPESALKSSLLQRVFLLSLIPSVFLSLVVFSGVGISLAWLIVFLAIYYLVSHGLDVLKLTDVRDFLLSGSFE